MFTKFKSYCFYHGILIKTGLLRFSFVYFRHEQQADDIDNIAKMAFNVSTQAYEIAKTAVSEQEDAR